MKYIRLLGLLAFTLAFLPALAAGQEARTTRDLVFDDEEVPAIVGKAKELNLENPEIIEVKTTLDLTRDGRTESVPVSHEFQSGDKVVLRYTTNADGYVYWLAKMSSGQYAILFPSPKTGSDNFVKRNEEHTVPAGGKGTFRFDDKPGTESLLMVFSPEKLPDLEQAVVEAANKDGNIQQSSVKLAALEDGHQKKRATRDLVFEEEEEENVTTKSQAGVKGEPFVSVYNLIHNLSSAPRRKSASAGKPAARGRAGG